MSRLAKIEPEECHGGLEQGVRPEHLTPLEQGLMRFFAHCPELAKGLGAFSGALKVNRTLGF